VRAFCARWGFQDLPFDPRRAIWFAQTIWQRVSAARDVAEHPLAVWREHRKLSGAKLATLSGVSQSYISEIETRKKPGSLAAMAKLARALGVTIDDLTPES
jgi:predicted transcriptional regulator